MTYFWCARHNIAEKAGFDTGECLLTGPYSTKAQAEEFGKLPKSSEQKESSMFWQPRHERCQQGCISHHQGYAPCKDGICFELQKDTSREPNRDVSAGTSHTQPDTPTGKQAEIQGALSGAAPILSSEKEQKDFDAWWVQWWNERQNQPTPRNAARAAWAASQSATGESVPNAIRHDAMRWRALFECSRIRVLGYARGGPKGRDGPIRHIGFEWTTDQEPYCDTELLDGKERLVEFTDAILNASADNCNKEK